jgi:hypothetical protein
MEETMITDQGEVRVELIFNNGVLGFALFSSPGAPYELCLVDVEDKKIIVRVGNFKTLEEVQTEYRHFCDMFVSAMRKIEW